MELQKTAASKSESPNPLSISQVNRLFQGVLEQNVPHLFFEGEIGQFTRAASGHLYFTLKDEQSELSAVMWRGSVSALRFSPEAGDQVACVGKPSVYVKNGRLQVVVQRMQLAGEGELQAKFLKLKAKLEKEGFFAEERKREIPFFPKAIGVVTSESGAVIHDIMTKIRERMPHIPVSYTHLRAHET